MNRTVTSKKTTIVDVSLSAGVSTATVSRVINNTGQVAQETADRVLNVINELNYIPNPSARVLAGASTATFGLIIPEIGSRALLPLLAGIEETARENGYQLLIYSTGGRVATSDSLLRVLGHHNVDGVLIYVNSLTGTRLHQLVQIGMPVVLLHQSSPHNLPVPYVTFNNKEAAKKLVDHLIEFHGLNRIAYLRGPEGHEDSLQREQGYRDSLETHGLIYDPSLVGDGGFNYKDAYQLTRRWLKERKNIDSIFAGADDSAAGCIQAIQEFNLRVPEDIAVVGFDDIELSFNITPPLTTIHADFAEAGKQATKALIKLVQHRKTRLQIILPTQLIIRQSCGCNKHDTESSSYR